MIQQVRLSLYDRKQYLAMLYISINFWLNNDRIIVNTKKTKTTKKPNVILNLHLIFDVIILSKEKIFWSKKINDKLFKTYYFFRA